MFHDVCLRRDDACKGSCGLRPPAQAVSKGVAAGAGERDLQMHRHAAQGPRDWGVLRVGTATAAAAAAAAASGQPRRDGFRFDTGATVAAATVRITASTTKPSQCASAAGASSFSPRKAESVKRFER